MFPTIHQGVLPTDILLRVFIEICGVTYQNIDNSHTHNLTQSLAVHMCSFWIGS